MKNIIKLLILIATLNVSAQELSLNKSTKFYEFSKIVETKKENIKESFLKRFNKINLDKIQDSESYIKGLGFANHLVGGFATVEIKYSVKIDFKNGKYRLTLTNFVLTDKNGSNPLEGMRFFKKKWVRKINKKLPEIISNIENINEKNDDW